MSLNLPWASRCFIDILTFLSYESYVACKLKDFVYHMQTLLLLQQVFSAGVLRAVHSMNVNLGATV